MITNVDWKWHSGKTGTATVCFSSRNERNGFLKSIARLRNQYSYLEEPSEDGVTFIVTIKDISLKDFGQLLPKEKT